MPTMIRWWEALRAPEVPKWQQKCGIDQDAADGRAGGAQRTGWEILMEMERVKCRAGEQDVGAVALVLDLAKAFEPVSLPVVQAWATHFSFPRKILRVLCGSHFARLRIRRFVQGVSLAGNSDSLVSDGGLRQNNSCTLHTYMRACGSC